MEKQGVVEGIMARVFTSAGAAGGVTIADHGAVVQGALVALAGVAIDLLVKYLRTRFAGR